MRRNLIIALGALTLAITVWLVFFRSSDEDLVRRAVARAAKAVEVVPGENPVLRATRVRSELLEVLAPEVAATIPELTDVGKGRDPLIGVAIAAAQLWEQAEVGTSSTRIALSEVGGVPVADVDLTATLNARRAGQPERDLRKVRFHLEKREGAWRITEVTAYPRSD